MSELHPILTALSGACAGEPDTSGVLADRLTIELFYRVGDIKELLAALKEAQYFILAPAEDLKDGVLSRIREAIAKAEDRL